MSKKLYEESNIQEIASTIREKKGTQDTYKVSQMAEAMSDLIGPPAYNNMILAQDTQPDSEYNKVWFDTDADDEYTFPEIDDNNVSSTDTWSSQKIKAEDDELKSAITPIEEEMIEAKLIPCPNLIGTNRNVYYPVSLTKGDKITVSTKTGGNFDSSLWLYFYDENKSQNYYVTLPTNSNAATFTITSDYDIAFIKWYAATMEVMCVYGETAKPYVEYYAEPKSLNTELGKIQELQDFAANEVLGIIPFDKDYNHYIYNGTEQGGTGCTLYIDVSQYDKIRVGNTSNIASGYNYFYDSSKDYIPNSGFLVAANDETIVDVPSGAKYVRLSYDRTYVDSLTIRGKNETTPATLAIKLGFIKEALTSLLAVIAYSDNSVSDEINNLLKYL